MKLVKFGTRYINVEHIIDVALNDDGNVWINTLARSNDTKGILLQANDATVFLKWLEHNSDDPTQMPSIRVIDH